MPRREEFLSCALSRFARNGYAATSTREICADVGLAHSAIYNYFPSKEAVILAIEEREMARMQAGLDALLTASRAARPIEKLTIALRYTFMVALEGQAAWRLMSEMLRSLKPKNRSLVIARRDRYEAAIRQLMQAAVEDGSLPDQDVRLSSLYVFGIAEGMAGWFRPNAGLSADRLADHATAFTLGALTSPRGNV